MARASLALVALSVVAGCALAPAQTSGTSASLDIVPHAQTPPKNLWLPGLSDLAENASVFHEINLPANVERDVNKGLCLTPNNDTVFATTCDPGSCGSRFFYEPTFCARANVCFCIGEWGPDEWYLVAEPLLQVNRIEFP